MSTLLGFFSSTKKKRHYFIDFFTEFRESTYLCIKIIKKNVEPLYKTIQLMKDIILINKIRSNTY